MSLLCFFIFREEFGDILDVDDWPGEIVSASGGFETRGFCWKTCCCIFFLMIISIIGSSYMLFMASGVCLVMSFGTWFT